MNDSLDQQQYVTSTEVPVSIPVPAQTGPFTLSAIAGLFNIIAGMMLVAACLLFFGGATAYLSRLGLEGRIEGLTYMMWGVRVLFVLVVILGVVQYVQYHTEVVMWLIAAGIVFIGGYVALSTIQANAAAADEH